MKNSIIKSTVSILVAMLLMLSCITVSVAEEFITTDSIAIKVWRFADHSNINVVDVISSGETYASYKCGNAYGDHFTLIFPDEVYTYDYQLTAIRNDGTIYTEYSGTPQHIYERPNDQFYGSDSARCILHAVNYLTVCGYDETGKYICESSFILLAQRPDWKD